MVAVNMGQLLNYDKDLEVPSSDLVGVIFRPSSFCRTCGYSALFNFFLNLLIYSWLFYTKMVTVDSNIILTITECIFNGTAVLKWTIWVCTTLAAGGVRVSTQDMQEWMTFSKDHWHQRRFPISWSPWALHALTVGGRMGSLWCPGRTVGH